MTQKDVQQAAPEEGALERALTTLEQDPAAAVALSDEELAKIVGGVFLKTVQATLAVRGGTPAAGEEENCGPGSCHPACNSWCHDFKA